MHYIPFINEDPKNRYEDLNCRNCPMFEGSTVYNMKIVCTCPFNGGYTEEFDIDQKVIQLKQAITRNCPVRYRDPVERFNYLQFKSIVNHDFYNCCKELFENKNLSDEERKTLIEKRDKIMKLATLMEELYPKFEHEANKIMLDGYKMDENGELFK